MRQGEVQARPFGGCREGIDDQCILFKKKKEWTGMRAEQKKQAEYEGMVQEYRESISQMNYTAVFSANFLKTFWHGRKWLSCILTISLLSQSDY